MILLALLEHRVRKMSRMEGRGLPKVFAAVFTVRWRVLRRGRPIIGADIKHFTDIGHFKNRFADNFFFLFFFMQTNILFTGDIIY